MSPGKAGCIPLAKHFVLGTGSNKKSKHLTLDLLATAKFAMNSVSSFNQIFCCNWPQAGNYVPSVNLPPETLLEDGRRPERAGDSVGNGNGSGIGVAASSEEAELASIPSVGLRDIKIIKELGYGRNGSVFLARWRDRDVDMKQFDIIGDGSQAFLLEMEVKFGQELSAYVRHENEWSSCCRAALPFRIVVRTSSISGVAARPYAHAWR